MAGTMPIATLGCGDWYCLVIGGPHAGEIWFDNRSGDGMPPDPVVDDDRELMRDKSASSTLPPE